MYVGMSVRCEDRQGRPGPGPGPGPGTHRASPAARGPLGQEPPDNAEMKKGDQYPKGVS